jgi:hypothetical protein
MLCAIRRHLGRVEDLPQRRVLREVFFLSARVGDTRRWTLEASGEMRCIVTRRPAASTAPRPTAEIYFSRLRRGEVIITSRAVSAAQTGLAENCG